jgi:hypothetical protein
MILPIVFSAALMSINFLYEWRIPKLKCKFLLWAIILSTIGIYFFVKGLDDKHDWYYNTTLPSLKVERERRERSHRFDC